MGKTMYQDLNDDYDFYIEDLRKFIQIASITTHKEKVIYALNYLVDLANDFGLEAKTVCDNKIGIIEYGTGPKTCGILCHVDVAPANHDEWSYEPFDLTTTDDKLYGRGVIDGKGPCLLLLYILKYFKKHNIKTKHKIQMIIGTHEEAVWTDITEYCQNFSVPDYGFTPDGFFPIQNVEKGLLDLAFEFAKANIETINAGNATNTVASEFDIIIDNEKHHYEGKAVHSSRPNLGENAIVLGCHDLVKYHSHFLFDFVVDYLSDYYGEKFGLRQDDIINEKHHNKTTIVPTMLEESQDELYLSVNIRLAHDTTYNKIKSKLDEIATDYQFTYREFDYLPPMHLDKNTPFIQKLAKAYEKMTGFETEYIFASKTSYAKALPNFVCFGPLLPNSEDTSHQANEYLSRDNLFMAYNIYFQALLELTV